MMFMSRPEDEYTFSRWRRAFQAVETVHAKAELMYIQGTKRIPDIPEL